MRSLAALGVLGLACVSATRAGAQEAALRPVLEERGGVLDPLVGPIVPLPWAVQGTQADDIAFDPATGVYLAVGTEPVRGQLLDGGVDFVAGIQPEAHEQLWRYRTATL